jgi:CBS domain-containing membrane protein
MISVESIMTPDPATLSENDTLDTAHQLMADKHIHHIPIVDKNDALVGLISHRDILAARGSTLNSNPSDTSQTPLSKIMTSPVASISPETGTLKAAQYIHQSRHGCLPIVDDGSLIGIITEYDFVEVAINLLERREDKAFEDNRDNDDTFTAGESAEELGIDTTSAQDWD